MSEHAQNLETVATIRAMLTGPSRRMTWHVIPWADCPECGDAIVSPAMLDTEWPEDERPEQEGLCVYDSDPCICVACRRVWSWSVDDHAWKRGPGEDVPMVEPGVVSALLEGEHA